MNIRLHSARKVLLPVAGGVFLAGALGLFAPGLNAQPEGHPGDFKERIERVHAGKVDAAALARIAAEAANPHGGGTAHGSTLEKPLAVQIAQYLKAPDSSPRARPAASRTATPRIAAADGARQQPPARTPSSPPGTGGDTAAGPDSAAYAGKTLCEACHRQEARNWGHTIHAKVFSFNPRDNIQALGCEACHGPGAEHVSNPEDLTKIVSFSNKSRTPISLQNEQCLGCHRGGQRIFWRASMHDNNSLACSDCHNPMANFSTRGLTARDSISGTCFQCHKVQRAEFAKRSHMPLLEGKITCTDCHNPHGSTTQPLLKADSINELCYNCHAEKRGPYIFEHAPVRQNCASCHSPHGSNFEALLNTPRPVLCQQCHAQDNHPAQLMTSGNLIGGPIPDPRLIATSCQTCHVNIHGSNSPSGPRFER